MACVAAIITKIIDCHRIATDLLSERLSKKAAKKIIQPSVTPVTHASQD